ncbi:hypothetical protein [Aquimarina spongiae]|uniref:Uncharacterized protein n=1 Tax=Aquimarina spongiae TaxID=570521 RepID=A0A1M6KUD7_9FLAO|nr:hypothetical protein [Aquimarina spongiae]SHJ62543.1 hypothetical protein SAMN04488508_11271 [Aquimarina spongiae]
MIITWFTDPSKGTFTEGSGKFSSYYQYDTETKKFVRIRLELGRQSSGSDLGETGAFFKNKRAVGFSSIDFIEKVAEYPDSDFTIDKSTGKLLLKGDPMSTTPTTGDNVVDMSPGQTKPHFGNSVASKAFLPPDIEPKHLSLIANNAIANGESESFTTKSVTGTQLSDALKGKVCDIMGVEDFNTISDADILKKLKSQIAEIKEELTTPSKKTIDSSLEDVDKLLSGIKEKMETDGIAPTEDFEDALEDLGKKVKAAKEASESGEGVKKAITDLESSRATLKEAVKTLSEAHQSTVDDLITGSDKAIETAQSASDEWERIDTEYQESEEASSIKEYEASIGNEEAEPVELK